MASKLSVITDHEAVPKGSAPAAAAAAAAAFGHTGADEGGPLARAFAQASAARPVLIAALFYKRADLARRLAASLIPCAKELRAINGEVLFINDSPDDPELAAALEEISSEIGDAFTWRILNNPQ